MPHTPYASTLPPDSAIRPLIAAAYFHDAWSIRLREPQRSVFELFMQVFARAPKWVEFCMRLRNRITSAIGLKDLGGFGDVDVNRPASDYQIGDRIGIFTLLQTSPHEIIVGDDDKHLRVTLSIHKGDGILTVTTIVQVKNRLGRVYMLLVRPMHKLIAPATLRPLG